MLLVLALQGYATIGPRSRPLGYARSQRRPLLRILHACTVDHWDARYNVATMDANDGTKVPLFVMEPGNERVSHSDGTSPLSGCAVRCLGVCIVTYRLR